VDDFPGLGQSFKFIFRAFSLLVGRQKVIQPLNSLFRLSQMFSFGYLGPVWSNYRGKASSHELKMVERTNRMAMWRRILAVGPNISLADLPAHFLSPTHASSTYSLTKMHSWLTPAHDGILELLDVWQSTLRSGC